MELATTITAVPREQLGKEAAGRIRRSGKVPAIYYGKNQTARPITVDYKEMRLLLTSSSRRSLFRLRIEGEGGVEEKTVMLKDHQIDPLKRSLIHADFFEVDLTRALQIDVPLVLIGKPEGVERGGMLQQIRHVVTVSSLPHNVPSHLEYNVASMDMGDSLHVSELETPEGVSAVFDVDFTLCTVIAPKGVKSDEEEEGEGEEAEAAEGGQAEPASEG